MFKSNWKELFIKFLAVLNASEGVIHLIVASIGLYGVVDVGIYDWKLLIAPIENLIFGVFSLVTGIVIGKGFGNH